jgi:hypothetical protein
MWPIETSEDESVVKTQIKLLGKYQPGMVVFCDSLHKTIVIRVYDSFFKKSNFYGSLSFI